MRTKIGWILERGKVTKYSEDHEKYWIDNESYDSKYMTYTHIERYQCNNQEPDTDTM